MKFCKTALVLSLILAFLLCGCMPTNSNSTEPLSPSQSSSSTVPSISLPEKTTEPSSAPTETAKPTPSPEPSAPVASPPENPPQATDNTSANDAIIADLLTKKQSDVQVTGSGVVTRILADDNEGDRHQRFILKLASGQTLLMAHNIDIAPRIDNIAVGDKIEFYGEYYYSEQGGGVHWTHRDPDGKHVDGWLKCGGTVYQ